VVGGAGVGVLVGVDVVPGGDCVCMLVVTVIVGVKTLVTTQRRVASFATHLARYLVAIATTTSATIGSTSTTVATTISMTTRRSATASAAMKGYIHTDELMFFLSLHPRLNSEMLRVEVVERMGLSLGREGLNKGIVLKIQPYKDVRDHLLIIQTFSGRHHLVGKTFHFGVISHASCVFTLARTRQHGSEMNNPCPGLG
jgi:hypothetical protein